MAKDKPRKKLSINDVIKEEAAKTQEGARMKSYLDMVQDEFEYNEDIIKALEEYNKTIADFDPLYSNLKPRFKVLVRCYTNEIKKDENGLIVPNTIPVPIKTKSGHGDIAFVETPWPYAKKVVVVAAHPNSDLKKGDVVTLDKNPITAALGNGNNALLAVSNGFVHPDESGKYSSGFPTDPQDKNYGYLLVADYDLEVII